MSPDSPLNAEHRPTPPMTRREARERDAARRADPVRPEQSAPPQQGATPQQPAQAAPQQARPDAQPEAQAEARATGAEPEPQAHELHHWLNTIHSEGTEPRKARKEPRPARRRRRAVTWIVSTIVILGLVGGGALFAWTTFQPQVKAVLSAFHHEPTDWTGSGTGSVDVTIKDGDTGATIATTLAHAGVTRTSQAFYQLLLQTKPDPVFQPGVYRLRSHMSAASALALLQDPSSRVAHTLLIREGESEAAVLQQAATVTGIPLAQLQAAAKNPASFGLPAQAKTLEGFLYPATYTFDPSATAQQVLTTLVSRAKQQFTSLGIPPAKLWDTVILASIVQKEAGPNPADLPLIAGVFQNRLSAGMVLQSDATVAYGTGKTGTVWTSDAERADAGNPYNTYVHKGLPPGPIGNPGSAALDAALHPQGNYLYFTVVNLQTGQTAFAKTVSEQDANVAKLQAWCREPGNASYCK